MCQDAVSEELTAFLLAEGVYLQFINNIKKYTTLDFSIYPTKVNTISDAFIWDKADEGVYFWIKVDIKHFKKELAK